MVRIYLGGEAEIRIYDDRVEKIRKTKRYRIKELDEILRKKRTITEAKIISAARKAGVATPIIFDVEDDKIVMEKIDGYAIKDAISKEVCFEIGRCVAKLHRAAIIHGDLTPMNMILCDGRVYFIDFGLSFYDERLEAKGTDIHVFFEALKAGFDNWEELWESFVEGYKAYEKFEDVMERFREIELRGRYVERD